MKSLDDVIKAYEICLNERSCDDCPYTEHDAEGKWACSLCGDCTRDTLYYLKKYNDDKEKVAKIIQRIKTYNLTPPKDMINVIDTRTTWWYECELCGQTVEPTWRYCPHCGSKLKWSEIIEK